MFSNEQVAEYVNDLMKEFEKYINAMEVEIKKDEPDYKTIALNVGKLSKTYSLVSYLTGVFSNVDLRVGGYREAVKAMRDRNVGEE